MQIQKGFSYHIKDDFFLKFNIKKFMKNKENGNYRPHYYAIEYKNDTNLFPTLSLGDLIYRLQVNI